MRGLVEKYPPGAGILKEFLQNADDAGAKSLDLILDQRRFSFDRLPYDNMHVLQGQSLVSINDARFTDDDWKKIRKIGASGKSLDKAKTGRFGLGFCSVYSITDFPMILTNERLGVFDPHGYFTAGKKGHSWKLANLWSEFPDLLRPFMDFGLGEGQVDFDGAIFRLPLRNPEMAAQSEISKEIFSTENFDKITPHICNQASDFVLFLNSITGYNIAKIGETGIRDEILSVQTINDVEVQSVQKALHKFVSLSDSELFDSLESQGFKSWFYENQLEIKEGDELRTENWSIVRGVYSDKELEIVKCAQLMFQQGRKAIPLAGAAICLDSPREVGSLSCALPFSAGSGVPINIDGFFDLEDNRQDLIQDSTTIGIAKLRYEWNQVLVKHGCAEAAAQLLTEVGSRVEAPVYPHWPTCDTRESKRTIDALPTLIYAALINWDCISVGENRAFTYPCEAVNLPANSKIRQPLLEDGVLLADPSIPSHVLKGFQLAGNELASVTPEYVAERLRDLKFENNQFKMSARSCLRNKDWIVKLLEFCLTGNDIDLEFVPLALMNDELLRNFLDEKIDDSWLFLGGANERGLLEGAKNVFLDGSIQSTNRIETAPNVKTLELDDLIECLPKLWREVGDGQSVKWNQPEVDLPTAEWLTEFYHYCCDYSPRAQSASLPSQDYLKQLPLVPDNHGNLWGACNDSTPVLIAPRYRHRFDELLDAIGVAVVDGSGELGKAISRFADAFVGSGIRKLSPKLLVKLIFDNLEILLPILVGDHSQIDSVLNFIASEFDETEKGTRNWLDKLACLPIFPLQGGGLTAISKEVYLASDFSPPDIETEFKILSAPNRQLKYLYDLIHIQELNRATYATDFVLANFEVISVNDQFAAAEWLRENYYSLLKDFDGNRRKPFEQRVRATAFVRCNDANLHAPNEIYHPECREVAELLGTSAVSPDRTIYQSDDWLDFLSTLGMAREIRAEDLLMAIDNIVACTPTPQTTAKIQKIAKHMGERWNDICDKKKLAASLSKKEWLPAITECPPDYPVELFRRPKKKYYSPKSIARRDEFEVVGSVLPVCEFRLEPASFAASLNHSFAASQSVLSHFENLVDEISDAKNADPRIRGILEKLYKKLGKAMQYGKFPVDHIQLSNRFSTRNCLFDEKGKLWPPKLAFHKEVACFIGLRGGIGRFEDQSAEFFVAALGRKSQPDIDDFECFFEEVGARFSGKKVPSDLLRLLRKAYVLFGKLALDGNGGFNVPILTNEDKLVSSSELLLNDTKWIGDNRLNQANVVLVDKNLDRYAEAYGIDRVSQVISEKVKKAVRDTQSDFSERCDRLIQTLRSKWFRKGLLRLAQENIDEEVLDDIRSLELIPSLEIHTSLIRDGVELPNSLGTTDQIYDEASNRFYSRSILDSVLRQRLAETVINRILRCPNLPYVAMMLENTPEQIDQLLDQMKIPLLPEGISFDELDWEEEELPENDSSTSLEVIDSTNGEALSAVSTVEPQRQTEDSNDDGLIPSKNRSATSTPTEKLSNLNRDSAANAIPEPEKQGNKSKLEVVPGGSKLHAHASRPSTQSPASTAKPRARGSGSSYASEQDEKSSQRKSRAVTYMGSGDATPDDNDDLKNHRSNVDKAAISRVVQEESKIRSVTQMDFYNKGYDIESESKETGKLERYIEVKGLSGEWNDFGVKLTPAQVEFCRIKGDKHWLYVVEFALEDRFEIHMIQNPLKQVTDYRFDAGWKQFSSSAVPGTPITPSKGCRVSIKRKGIGLVAKVLRIGKFMRLHVEMEDGTIEKMNFPNADIEVIQTGETASGESNTKS